MDQRESGLNINMPTAVIIAGLFIAGAILLSNPPSAINDTNENVQGPNSDEPLTMPAIITDDDHFYGNPKAKIVMVEYSDTECPFCKSVHPTFKKMVDESRGQVAWVYRHFPLDNIHKKARVEAMATECVAELGGNDKFWEYTERLFEVTPSNDQLDPARLPQIALDVGLDANKFNECLSSEKYKEKIETHLKDGLAVGVTGTPTTVLLNTKGEAILVSGAQPESKFIEEINKLLN